MDIRKIGFIQSSNSLYDSINCISKDIVHEINELYPNIKANMISMADSVKLDYLDRIADEYDVIVAINGMLINSLPKFRDILNEHHTLCWTMLFDHPYFHHSRLCLPVDNQIVSVVDRAHLKYMNRFYPSIRNSLFLPHGAMFPTVEPNKWNERPYEVAFFGSLGSSDNILRILGNTDKDTREIMIAITEYVWNGTFNRLEDCSEYFIKSMELYHSEEEFAELMESFSIIDSYIRNERRTLLVEIIAAAGIDVHVFGSGWDKLNIKALDHLIIHKPLNYGEALNEMSKAKIVLNQMPLFTDGSHDRVFNIPLAGSICITDSNPYIEEIFTDREDIFLYDLKNMENLPEIINEILKERIGIKHITDNAKNKIMQGHMWRNRVITMMEHISDILSL